MCLKPVHTERASTHQIKLMLKIVSIHMRRRASSNLHTSNQRCQFKLCIFNENMDDERLMEAVQKEAIIYDVFF